MLSFQVCPKYSRYKNRGSYIWRDSHDGFGLGGMIVEGPLEPLKEYGMRERERDLDKARDKERNV